MTCRILDNYSMLMYTFYKVFFSYIGNKTKRSMF